ncbi:MAG: hypothetical protein FJ116_12720 [Deltaproteobacteria bacterium]|nr:hypothetical protein [Deltaproteobacteria bacterium]
MGPPGASFAAASLYTEVRQTSEIVEINPGETPLFHKKACAEFAERKYNQVMKSLQGLAASRIYWDELSQCNPKESINGTSVCDRWHNTLLPVVAAWTVPVCEKRSGQRNYFCAIRSKKGGACTHRDPETGRRLTRGMFEYPCAKGLECEVTKPAWWFNYAEAKCKVKPMGNSKSIVPSSANSSFTH